MRRSLSSSCGLSAKPDCERSVVMGHPLAAQPALICHRRMRLMKQDRSGHSTKIFDFYLLSRTLTYTFEPSRGICRHITLEIMEDHNGELFDHDPTLLGREGQRDVQQPTRRFDDGPAHDSQPPG